MISDLRDHPVSWRTRICRQIDSANISTSFSFQAELSVCWAVSKIASIRPLGSVEYSGYPPDIVSDDLFLSWETVIEVAMISKGDPDVPGRYPMTLRQGAWRGGRSAVGNKIADKDSGQLSKVPESALRILVLMDGGSRETENPRGSRMQWNEASPQEVLAQAAKSAKNTDLIAILYRRALHHGLVINSSPSSHEWAIEIYDLSGKVDPSPLRSIADLLPPIRSMPVNLRHHAAREPFECGILKGEAVTTYHWTRDEGASVMVSSQTLQKFLCQQEPLDYFEQEAIDCLVEIVRSETENGRVIKRVSLDTRGPDEDDDFVVFGFDRDPSIERLNPGA